MAMRVLATVKALKGFVSLVRDPRQIDGVFRIVDALRTPADVQPMIDHFAKTAVGRSALRDRARLRVDLDALGGLPAGTLGRAYADHMRAHGFDPSDFPSLPSEKVEDFVSAHLYETHDVWHVVTGMGTDVAGELGLQAFYLAQFPAKLGVTLLAAGMLNTLGPANFDDRERRMEEIVRGWLLGRASRPFFGVDWNALWAVPVTEVRARLGVDIASVAARLDGLTVDRLAA